MFDLSVIRELGLRSVLALIRQGEVNDAFAADGSTRPARETVPGGQSSSRHRKPLEDRDRFLRRVVEVH